jgi:YD repeat-containing protein
VLTTTDANGAVTQVTYNSQNFPTMITDPQGKTNTLLYGDGSWGRI